ncbi:hypothetical protein [uncultured Draconibacterium sp.]|uniref:hypothetical protein n=1 Tax=uncultured Draconibacterium sp. TaxID=1573823 RepID=UPI003217B696
MEKHMNYLPSITFLLLFSTILFLSSCNDKEDPIGLWDDNIKLSIKQAEFNAESDSIVVTTEGNWWWIDGISVNDSTYTFYDDDAVNLESEEYSIQKDCYTVERRNANTLFIKMDENSSGEKRLMTIYLQAGDYFDSVHIEQLAE